MDVNEIGAELHYYSRLLVLWSDKCTDGDITENQMEDKLDLIENMSTIKMKKMCKYLGA